MSKPSDAAKKAAELSFASMPGFIAHLFPGTEEQWQGFVRGYKDVEADLIDAAADEKWKPLVEAAQRAVDASLDPLTQADLRSALKYVKGE